MTRKLLMILKYLIKKNNFKQNKNKINKGSSSNSSMKKKKKGDKVYL